MVDSNPDGAKEFAEKFEALRSAKRSFCVAYKEFQIFHKTFFFGEGSDMDK